MEAHRSYERFEQGHRVTSGDGLDEGHGRRAALAVAVMAALLAVAAFLANETVKEVITGETQRSDASARLESNRVRIDIAEAAGRELRIARRLRPADARLEAEIGEDEREVASADTAHLDYELAEVGLEVGIVLASVSIIARRRWLLLTGGGVAAAGALLLVVGLAS